jgi:hypothetical protein
MEWIEIQSLTEEEIKEATHVVTLSKEQYMGYTIIVYVYIFKARYAVYKFVCYQKASYQSSKTYLSYELDSSNRTGI